MEQKRAESEKLTLNLGFVDLGRIDVMISEGFYANRSDFIRTAIRNQIAAHTTTVEQSVRRNTRDMGVREFSRQDLLEARQSGQKLIIRVVGLVRIADDVEPDLASAAIESIEVLGALQASAAVKEALRDRIT